MGWESLSYFGCCGERNEQRKQSSEVIFPVVFRESGRRRKEEKYPSDRSVGCLPHMPREGRAGMGPETLPVHRLMLQPLRTPARVASAFFIAVRITLASRKHFRFSYQEELSISTKRNNAFERLI